MSESKNILHENSFYEEWRGCVPGCSHPSAYIGVTRLHCDAPPPRMEMHRREVHRCELVRVFLNKVEMRTTLPVENLPHLQLKEIDTELADLQSYADHLIRGVEFRKMSRDYDEVHDD